MEKKKYIKNLEEFLNELKSNNKKELSSINKKWDNEMEEFEAITKKYKANEIKKKY